MKTVAEILPTLVQRLESVLPIGEAQEPNTKLLQDCLQVVKHFTQPYPPSKYSRAQFLELRDAMHEDLAVNGEFCGLQRFVMRGDNPPEENPLVPILLGALTTAALELSQHNAVIEKVAKHLEKNFAAPEVVAAMVRSLKIPSAGGVAPGSPGKEGD